MRIIDSHIHFDLYSEEERTNLLNAEQKPDYMIAVSMNLSSSLFNLNMAKKHSAIKPAFGFHPEQEVLSEQEQAELFCWMEQNVNDMIAVGEVGLPYYLRKENQNLDVAPYMQLLERFMIFAKKHNKPIILHAIYEDADCVCDLLEKYQINRAHFHWFKGSRKTIRRMIKNGYYISITPDVCYEEEIRQLVSLYPIELMMVETDGPWKFEGPFAGEMTNPVMMCESVKEIAKIKMLDEEMVYHTLYKNTVDFYRLEEPYV